MRRPQSREFASDEFSLNIYKDGEEPAVDLPDADYPDWLHAMSEKALSLEELQRMPEEEMTAAQRQSFHRMSKKRQLRNQNEASEIDTL